MKTLSIILLQLVVLNVALAVPITIKHEKVKGKVVQFVWRDAVENEYFLVNKGVSEKGVQSIAPRMFIVLSDVEGLSQIQSAMLSQESYGEAVRIGEAYRPWYSYHVEDYKKGKKLYLYLPISKELAAQIKSGLPLEIKKLEFFINDTSLVSVKYADLLVNGKSIIGAKTQGEKPQLKKEKKEESAKSHSK